MDRRIAVPCCAARRGQRTVEGALFEGSSPPKGVRRGMEPLPFDLSRRSCPGCGFRASARGRAERGIARFLGSSGPRRGSHSCCSSRRSRRTRPPPPRENLAGVRRAQPPGASICAEQARGCTAPCPYSTRRNVDIARRACWSCVAVRLRPASCSPAACCATLGSDSTFASTADRNLAFARAGTGPFPAVCRTPGRITRGPPGGPRSPDGNCVGARGSAYAPKPILHAVFSRSDETGLG